MFKSLKEILTGFLTGLTDTALELPTHKPFKKGDMVIVTKHWYKCNTPAKIVKIQGEIAWIDYGYGAQARRIEDLELAA